MPECMECGKDIELTQWNIWNIFHICYECEEHLNEKARCPYCNGYFPCLRASKFKEHIENCRKNKKIHKNLNV